MNWQSRLLFWYRANRRDLPWRRTKDPYKIWVSEVMLQQTTVEVVISYYQRFLRRFPNLRSLAESDEEEVLRVWSGLGYYSRARNLWKAAGDLTPRPPLLSKERGRKRSGWPQTVAHWQQLPGIGRYTAGAIASIAFGERAPILDGNVIRVLSRLFAIRQNPKSTEGNRLFWKRAEEILPQKDCGDFNQALMELGATVCLPASPRCSDCPLSSICRARQEGRPTSYPRGKKKVTTQKIQLSIALVEQNGKLLMQRRPDRGFLKGMWEFPPLEKRTMDIRKAFEPVQHSIMNQRLTVTPYLCKLKSPHSPLWQRGVEGGFRWFIPNEINNLNTSSMNRKILERWNGNSKRQIQGKLIGAGKLVTGRHGCLEINGGTQMNPQDSADIKKGNNVPLSFT